MLLVVVVVAVLVLVVLVVVVCVCVCVGGRVLRIPIYASRVGGKVAWPTLQLYGQLHTRP